MNDFNSQTKYKTYRISKENIEKIKSLLKFLKKNQIFLPINEITTISDIMYLMLYLILFDDYLETLNNFKVPKFLIFKQKNQTTCSLDKEKTKKLINDFMNKFKRIKVETKNLDASFLYLTFDENYLGDTLPFDNYVSFLIYFFKERMKKFSENELSSILLKIDKELATIKGE